MFQSPQVLVFRMSESTSAGAAAMRVCERTVKVPPGPCVGTGSAGTRDAVTGDVLDSDVGG